MVTLWRIPLLRAICRQQIQVNLFYPVPTYLHFCLFILLLVVAILTSPARASQQRTALVIGNTHYSFNTLVNPENDASDIARTLKSLGFEVDRRLDITRQEMRRAIRAFGDRIRKNGGVGLFYYAGHGIQINGENYLVPLATDVLHEDEVPDECVPVSSVLRKMESANNRLNIIILDACRDNPFKRSFRSGSRGLARMDAPAGSILAYATSPGSSAQDGRGRNGLYTEALLENIHVPGLSLEQLFKRMRIAVVERSGGRQVPWESSSLMGDFFFKPYPEKPQVQKAPVEKTIADREIIFWDSIRASDNPVLFQSYLDKYPNGTFAALARVRVKELINVSPSQAQKRVVSGPPADKTVSKSKEIGYVKSLDLDWGFLIIKVNKPFSKPLPKVLYLKDVSGNNRTLHVKKHTKDDLLSAIPEKGLQGIQPRMEVYTMP